MKINEDVIERMILQAQEDAPIETCGYLMGNDDVVTESYWMENIDHSEEHFSFAPKDQFAALKYGKEVVQVVVYLGILIQHRHHDHRKKIFVWHSIHVSATLSFRSLRAFISIRLPFARERSSIRRCISHRNHLKSNNIRILERNKICIEYHQR